MSKTYCGVVAAYQALEVKIKYLTQNETFVLLYRKWADHMLQTIQEFGFLRDGELWQWRRRSLWVLWHFSRSHFNGWGKTMGQTSGND